MGIGAWPILVYPVADDEGVIPDAGNMAACQIPSYGRADRALDTKAEKTQPQMGS
jgi:hypothetical protein